MGPKWWPAGVESVEWTWILVIRPVCVLNVWVCQEIIVHRRVEAQECKLLSVFDTWPSVCLSGCRCVCECVCVCVCECVWVCVSVCERGMLTAGGKAFVDSWLVAPNSPPFVSVHINLKPLVFYFPVSYSDQQFIFDKWPTEHSKTCW